MTGQVDIRPQDLAIVLAILDAALPENAMIWAFGSRATGTARNGSDLDLAIDAGRRLTETEQGALRDGFEDSDLPYTVDVVDMRAVSAGFRATIERDRVVVRDGRGEVGGGTGPAERAGGRGG